MMIQVCRKYHAIANLNPIWHLVLMLSKLFQFSVEMKIQREFSLQLFFKYKKFDEKIKKTDFSCQQTGKNK